MGNELKHGSVGTELTQAEWEAVGTHVIDSQAEGDIIYASSSAQLSRLGKGADNTVLHLASGVPAWSATLAGLTLTTPTISATGFANANHAHAAGNSGGVLTYLGTIATGVWQGTDVGVAYGGTGVSTLTQNGVLVGNGASAIGAIDMSTKGHVLIGDGSGNPQMLGVGTDTHVLTADSGETTGVKWAAPAAAAAGSLTGATLASGVTASALTSLGTQAEDLDMGGYDIDNAGFVILNAATAPAGTEVYAVNDNTGDLTVNALSGKKVLIAIDGADEYGFSATALDMNSNGLGGASYLSTRDTADTSVTHKQKTHGTQDVTTSAVDITADLSGHGGLLLVTGMKTTDSNVRFFDVVIAGNQGVSTLHQLTLKGSPASRTYTIAGYQVQLQMGADTYDIGTHILELSNPA